MTGLLALRRLFYSRKVNSPLVREWLCVSLPGKSLDARHARYLVVDLEMTGLNDRSDKIVSIGWVAIDEASISLHSAQHYYLRRSATVGDSATIHQIRDVDLEQGISEQQALEHLLEASKGRVVVFHSAPLDYAFLNVALRACFSVPFLSPIVDTLKLEQQLFQRRDIPVKPGDLRLANCRERYNLPFYPAHNALVDALATAELLLAILANKGACSLRSILA